ncbi:ATP-binding protein [Kitasatospora sp. MY 5-36]|uniref:HD domain-containing protein n=1 Tax=Kitasatospora sp. MY 5-36 TaxID=1678027 RepID=UPI00131E755E|nr:ATP-binding protein [Kitasatospora sp. MY 5-36]
MGDAEIRNIVDGGTFHGPVIQGGTVHFHLDGRPPHAGGTPEIDPWTAAATASAIWDHVPAARETTIVRAHTLAVVGALAAVRDRAEAALGDDPWQDPVMAVRFAERVEWLLGEPEADGPFELYPAEAALLVLLPFIYRANQLLATAQFAAAVTPARLESTAEEGPERLSFEAYAADYGMLRDRTQLRPESAAPIRWWLFHRWLLRRGALADPADVARLLDTMGEQARPLGEILDTSRITHLLHGIRRGPDVANAEFLEQLPADDRVRGPGHQRVRDRRLVLLLALAFSTCLDVTALPDVVVEHLGIPHPVDLGQPRETVERAAWGGDPALPVLRADCHHEAVIEGLRAYTTRADEVLHAVARASRERITCAMPALPARLSADQVRPAAGVFDGWAGFRMDERRVRELLMGVQLYKDRDLAVRELYQNALDACRYRRARTEYLHRTEPASYHYEGRITFEQGFDRDGRGYVECRDNGIGMGEAELRGVFSQAGARFAEQAEFRLERAAWERLDPPVELFPNSRFGIGVLSYFMLTDELTVTTCRMGPTGSPGPVLDVSIHGPGHLFRIVERAPKGEECGTTVRLHLRESAASWSYVDVLERLLGVAEFDTAAVHGDRRADWPTGVVQVRKQPERERFGFDAHGVRAAWADAPKGVQVTWTEHGGALLVDGLVVQPNVRGGVLSTEDAGLSGVVVNLTGPYAPAQLSADRIQVLDDVSSTLLDLLSPAAEALAAADQPLPNYAWVCRLTGTSPQLADLLATAAIVAGRTFTLDDRTLDLVRTGILPGDAHLLSTFTSRRPEVSWDLSGFPPDHVLLWRLLAHAPHPALDDLAHFCPELRDITSVLTAMPSDQLLLSGKDERSRYWRWHTTEHSPEDQFDEAVERWGASPRDVARRAAQLSLYDLKPEGLLVVPAERKAVPDELLRCDSARPEAGWFDIDDTVPPGRIAQVSAELGLSVSEVCSRFHDLGLAVDAAGLPDHPTPEIAEVLRDLCEESSWLYRDRPLSPLQILKAAAVLYRGPVEILQMYQRLEFHTPEVFPLDASVDDTDLFENKWADGSVDRCPPAPIPYMLILLAAAHRPLPEVISRLEDYGYHVPLRAPSDPSDLDELLLDPHGPCSWWEVGTDDEMPFAHLLVAAQRTFCAPYTLVERFDAYGVPVSCRDLPQGLSLTAAMRLLEPEHSSDEGHLSKESPVSLEVLIERARRMGVPIAQVVEWLTQLGIPVPDVGRVLHDALARVPRP